jgi:class 3 adenylate cyclase/tetratricopeptide (TPR) repeat protein
MVLLYFLLLQFYLACFGRGAVMTSLRQWLDSIGLGQYAGAFEKHSIDWDVLRKLNHSVLKDIGVVSAGDRIRLLSAIKELGSQDDKKSETTTIRDAFSLSAGSGEEAQRRQLTVLFCDIVAYTDLAHRLDPEDLRDLTIGYQNVCESAIKRYEGVVARYVGDGVMAYFGYPQAHEEDAGHAVRAGLAIIDGIRQLNLQLVKRDIELSVRIGIATGVVVVGEAIDGTVLGEAPNVASRLQAAALPNAVVIAPETRRLASEYFEYRDLGEQTLKGLSAPIRAWQVLRERTPEIRFEMRHVPKGTPLVGRGEEIALILRRWQQVKDGEGQVLLLSGEPGIGKSRLVQALCEKVSADPYNLIRYQCSPYHVNSALYPIIEQMRRAAGFDESDSATTQLEKLEALLSSEGNEKHDQSPLFAALLSIDVGDRHAVSLLRSEARKDATLKALIARFVAISETKPLILVVEDAQWIDPTTKELLDLLLPIIIRKPFLVVITYRPEYRQQWSGLPNALTLPVTRLSRTDVILMIDKILAGKPMAQDILEQIIKKTDGVPLFVEELTKTIIESGQLIETDDSYIRDGPGSELVIPATIRDSLMARLDSAASMREVAQAGACVGRSFTRDILAAVLGLDERTLSMALKQLEAAELVFRTSVDNRGYAFKHALVRDAAYDSLLKSKRKQFHARIAENLAKSGNVIGTPPEVIAHHFMEAGENERAAHHWHQAAKYAGARYANREAMAHCTKALATLSRLPRSAERTKMELDVRIILADGLRITDSHTEALKELRSAEAIAIETEHVLELSRIHHMRGNIYYFLGMSEPCLAEHEAALNFAKRTGSIEDEARTLGGLGDANFLAGRIYDAHQKFDHCVTLSRKNELVITEVAYLPMRAVTHMYSLRYDESLKDCNATIDLVKRIGQARGELIARSTSSWIFLDKCELPIAEQHAQKGLEAVSVIGSRRFIPLFNDVIARLRLLAGDREGALELLEESWNISREASISFAGPVVLGAVAFATSDPQRRAEALQQGEAILREGCASHNHFRFYRDAIEVSLRERLWEDAKYYATALERYFGAQSSAWSDFIIARGRELAEAGNERPSQQARARLRQLRDHALTVGMKAAVPQLDEALGESVSQL